MDLPGRVVFAQPLLVSDHSMYRAAVVAAPLPGTHPGHSYDPKRAVYVLPESLSKANLRMLYLPAVRNSCSLQSDCSSYVVCCCCCCCLVGWLVGWFCSFPCMWMMWLGYLWYYSMHLFVSWLYEYAGSSHLVNLVNSPGESPSSAGCSWSVLVWQLPTSAVQ